MACDVTGGREVGRIAGYHLVVLVLIDADVVDSHRRRHERGETRKVERRETVRHAEVGNDGHGLLWNGPLAYVAVLSERSAIQGPGGFFAHVPGNVTFGARFVLECVLLVGPTVVPIVVEMSEARKSLLEWTACIGVDLGDTVVIYLRIVYQILAPPPINERFHVP